MAVQKVSTTWTLEREERGGKMYTQAELELEATFGHSEARGDDPGETRLEIDRVTCGGEGFTLTPEEEKQIIESWTEELLS